MKILLFGKTGQVGQSLIKKLSNESDFHFYGRDECDFENIDNISKVISNVQPDYIINAAAYTNVENAEQSRETCSNINVKAVSIIAREAIKHDAILIHFSTDYIFEGTSKKPYKETDNPAPINFYGKSKLFGEKEIKNSGCKYYILRTSWVVSRNGSNFINKMIDKFHTKEIIEVVDDQVGIPTTADFIAENVIKLINKKFIQNEVFNLTPIGETSWYGLAVYLYDRLKTNNKLMSDPKIIPVKSEKFKTIAKRPKNSRLDSSKIQSHLMVSFLKWSDYIDDIIN